MIKELLLAKKRGFCFGVDNAIDALNTALKESEGKKVYTYHDIVHNTAVVDDFKSRGVIFIEDIDLVDEGSVLVFSAHGVSKEIERKAAEKNVKLIDATCPLVKNVHTLIEKYEKEGKEIIVIGSKTHQEIIGTTGRIKCDYKIIEKVADVEKLEIIDPENIGIVTQTTLSVDDIAVIIQKIEEKFGINARRKLGNICNATQERQDAVKELASSGIDALFVFGSVASSNSNKLCNLGKSLGVNSFLIDSKKDLLRQSEVVKKCNKIGLTSGASAPEKVLQEMVEYFKGEGFAIKDLSI